MKFIKWYIMIHTDCANKIKLDKNYTGDKLKHNYRGKIQLSDCDIKLDNPQVHWSLLCR